MPIFIGHCPLSMHLLQILCAGGLWMHAVLSPQGGGAPCTRGSGDLYVAFWCSNDLISLDSAFIRVLLWPQWRGRTGTRPPNPLQFGACHASYPMSLHSRWRGGMWRSDATTSAATEWRDHIRYGHMAHALVSTHSKKQHICKMQTLLHQRTTHRRGIASCIGHNHKVGSSVL